MLMTAVGSLVVAAQAGAVPIPGTGGRHLSVEAESYPAQWNEVSPGDSVDWQFWTVLSGQAEASLSIQVASSGDLVARGDGLHLLLRQCAVPWIEDTSASALPARCMGAAGSTIVDAPLADIPAETVYPVGEMRRGSGPYFLATLSIPATMTITQQQSAQGWEGHFAFGLTAAGETATLDSDGGLAFTGADPSGFVLGGVGLLFGGIALSSVGFRLGRRRGRGSS